MAVAPTEVTINGERFSIDTIPKVGSQLVQDAKKNFLGSLNLDTLVADLGKLGNFIRLAYNGVAGNTDLQIKVQRVGYKITKLADKSAVTVANFKSASRDVLQELQGTYQYLLDGLDEMALETLSLLSKVAEQMAKAAEELHEEFEAATEDVQAALEDTQRAKGVQESEKEALEQQQKNFDMERKKMEELTKEAMEAEKKAEQYYDAAQKREDDAYESQNSFIKTVTVAIEKVLLAGVAVASLIPNKVLEKLDSIGDKTAYKEAMKKAAEEKMKHLDEMQKQRDIRGEAIQKCIEFTERIKNCKDDESLAIVAIDALHNSIGALKSLSAIMMDAALFWQQMQTHCEALAKKDMQQQVAKVMEFSEEKRMKVWTSIGFKTRAVQYYSKWVALDDVCGTYMEDIQKTRGDLYAYLRENPTVDQSRENVRRLAVTFKDDLERAQKEIADKDREARKERDQLKQ